jgi:predicted Zn-dependent protease
VRLPYFINFRTIALTVVLLLLIAGGAFGWSYWQNRPDNLYESALNDFHKAEKVRDTDVDKAKSLYERADTQLRRLLNKEPGMSKAHLLQYKVLMPLAKIEEKPNPKSAQAHFAEAFAAGARAAALDKSNVEAQAIMLDGHFRNSDFAKAYPYARTLIDNLPADESGIELDGFNDMVIGGYYVLALKAMDSERPNPEQALEYLAASQKREKEKPGAGPAKPRWRAAALEVKALLVQAEAARKAGAGRPAAADATQKFKTHVADYVERARGELKENVPPSDGKPELPQLATLSVTNANGLIDLLLISLVAADDREMVQQRSELLLDVCDKLAHATGANPWIYQEAARGTMRLPLVVAGLPLNDREVMVAPVKASVPLANHLTKDELARDNQRILDINNAILDKTAVNPAVYLQMASSAKDDRARALDLTKRGLKVAADQKISPDDPRVLELQLHAAWLLLLDKKVKEADEYLAEVSKHKMFTARVNYLQGLAAVLDGRLEEGGKKLAAARDDARLKDSLPLLLGLAQAYMGQGKLEDALPVLTQLQGIYDRQAKLDRDDQFWLDLWLPSREQVYMNLFRCHLALALRATSGQEATDHYKSALEYRKKLTFRADEANAALVNFHLTRARLYDSKKQTREADQAREAVQKLLEGLPASSRSDPRVLWAEVSAILSQPETNPAVIAGAVAAPLGAPTDPAVRLGELGLLRAGYGWHWLKAEQRIREVAKDQPDSTTAQLALVRWLQINGRTEEALATLAELQRNATTVAEKQQIQATRAAAELQAGHTEEADKLIESLRKDGQELPVAALEVLVQLRKGDYKEAQALLDKAVSKHDQSGLLHYWQGQVHQYSGEFAQAIPSYERSFQFAQFKNVSQNALLACVMGLASGPAGKPEKANPSAAFDEAARLRKAHPDDPAILLAYAMTARLMDRVYGPDGMEGALAKMVEVIRKDRPTAAEGAVYVAAGEWVNAGRPDRARQELKPNLEAKPPHLPSLVLATRLAVADEDWAEVATDLKALEKLQPDAVDLPLWQAGLHRARGETEDAKAIYKAFVEKNPKLNTGYLALAQMHENAKEYKEALDWVKKWRKEMPDEINGFRALVRVLARDGQVAEARKEADAFIKEQVKKARDAREEWERNNPIKDKDKEKEETEQRAKAKAELLNAVELALAMQVVGAFQEAKEYKEAETWLERSEPLIKKLPEAARKENRIAFQLLRGGLYLGQAKKYKEKSPERAKLMDQAIAEYDAVWKAVPGHVIAGNNLAWLLVKEKGDAGQALAVAEQVRKGKNSGKPVGGERLPVEFLDTLGVVYRASDHNPDALALFQEAMQRYKSEPRVVMHLAQAQAALQMKPDAYANFTKTINLADQRAKTSADPEQKDKMVRLKAEAESERKKVGG